MIDDNPLFCVSTADVDCGIIVRIQREATSLAKELRLRFAIRLLTMPTGATRAARVSGVYQMDRNPGPRCLVGDVLAQLIERPGMPLIAMFVSNRCTLSYSGQIFESDCLARYGGFLHQGLADAMVGICLEAAFLACVLAKASLGILGIDLLQSLAAHVVARANSVNHGTAEGLPVTVGSEVDNAQVYPQRSIIVLGFVLDFPALSHMQVIDATPPYQISAAHRLQRVYQHVMLASAQQQTTHYTPIQCIERYPVKTHQAIGTRVIAHTAPWPKLRTGFPFLGLDRFDGLDRFRPSANRQLRAQTKPLTGLTVNAVMGSVGVGNVLSPAHLRSPGRCFIKGALSRSQNCLMAINVQFDADRAGECFIHKKSIEQMLLTCNAVDRRPADGRFPPHSLKAWRFPAPFSMTRCTRKRDALVDCAG
ncbi:MAG TPA: hypothetical protein VF792_09920 [Ktedonobacterales bacterium]